MKKLLCAILIVTICMSMLLVGCVQNTGDKPDSYKGIVWTSSDYSFRFDPEKDCKGVYKFNDKKYNIQLVFDPKMVIAYDTDKNNTQLFNADWKYEEKDNLYLYNISFNTEVYKEMKDNYMEFIMLHQEKSK
ncbi:MAG: hypothetical protein K6F88_04655 [Ruminococcus sp.]|nr:hypothetical protein [Ruminococcus sp.]